MDRAKSEPLHSETAIDHATVHDKRQRDVLRECVVTEFVVNHLYLIDGPRRTSIIYSVQDHSIFLKMR